MNSENRLYVTGLDDLKTKTKRNFFPNSSKTSKTISIIKSKSFISKNEVKEKLSENFFDYLINKKSNYANFEKVYYYYEDKIRKKERTYNSNLEIIKQKKEDIKKINDVIVKNIVENLKLTDSGLDIYYQEKLEELKKDVTDAGYELDIYKKLYTDTYKFNYKLNSQLEKEYKLLKVNDEQHEKYINLRDVISIVCAFDVSFLGL